MTQRRHEQGSAAAHALAAVGCWCCWRRALDLPGDLHKQIAGATTFVGGYGGADPAEVIMAFYKKHKPPLANVAEAKTLATYQAKASGEGEVWQDMMFAEIAAEMGEDPRVAHAEYLNFQASAALAATRAMAASKGWAVVKGDAMSTSRRMLLAAKMMKTQRDEEEEEALAPAPAAAPAGGASPGAEPRAAAGPAVRPTQ